MIQNQKINDLERFAPCEDMICYEVPNDFFNQDSDDMNELSIIYLTFKCLLYLLFGFTLLTLGYSISTLIVMATDKRSALEDEDGDGEDDDSDDSESEYDETNYHHKYVNELNALLNALENKKKGDESQDESDENESQDKAEESECENQEECENESQEGEDIILGNELTNEIKVSLSDRILMETTPKGNVIMYYNHDPDDEARSSFHYYCDDKSIPFNYLDTVSRKYVCVYKCPQIYRYLEKEMKAEIQKMKEREELEKKRQEDKDAESESNPTSRKRSDSVFATFKNYKTQKQNQMISGGTGSTRMMNPNQLLLCKNRYKRLGSIEEYHFHLKQKERKEQEPVNIKPISFSEYKKMNQCE